MIQDEIDQMSTDERIRTMEYLWKSMLREPGQLPSPDWHEDILKARQERIASGKARFLSLEELKKMKSG